MADAIIRMTNPVNCPANARTYLLGCEPTANGPTRVVAIRNAGRSVNAADRPIRVIGAYFDNSGTRSAKTPSVIDFNVVAAGLRFTGAETYTVAPSGNETLRFEKFFPPSSTEWEPLVHPIDGTPLVWIPASKFFVLSVSIDNGQNAQDVQLEMLCRD